MSTTFFKRHEVRLLVACMTLLGGAALWLLSTRPGHKIEGDFYQREDTRTPDEWLYATSRSHPVAQHRARATLSVARIGGEDSIERLIRALQDEAPGVRAAAAFGLGLVEGALDGDAREPDRQAVNALLRALGDADRQVVANAVEALGKLRWAPAAAAVASTPAPLVYTFVALARMDQREFIPWIVQRLRSDDQDTRWAAAVTLIAMHAPLDEALQRSFVRLSRDRNDFVRAAVTRGLGFCSPDDAVFAALENTLADRDPKVRFEAVAALERLGVGERAELLRAVVQDPNANIRAAVEHALRTLVDPSLGLRRLWGPPEPRPTLESLAEPVPLVEQDYQPIARTQGRRLIIETSSGSFEMALDYDHAPLASERFWRLASAGAFDAQPVAVVRPNGYVQVAPRVDPQPVAWRPEFNSNPFLRGSVGMVRATRDLDSPEFFIALTPLPFIDGRYTNVGRLLSGDDKLDALTTQTRILSIAASR